MAKVEMAKDMDLQLWNLFAIWASSCNVYPFTFVKTKRLILPEGVQMAKCFPDQTAKSFCICKWRYCAISTFGILKEIASDRAKNGQCIICSMYNV